MNGKQRKNKRGRRSDICRECNRLRWRLRKQDKAIDGLISCLADEKRASRTQDRIIEYQRKAIDVLVETRDSAYATIGTLKDQIKELEQSRRR